MKLRWHHETANHDPSDRSNDDGGGEGAEYLDGQFVDDNEADRDSWLKARHWDADHKQR